MSEKPKFNFINPEYIVALGVTIISLCALVVSIMQTQIMKEERELMREYSRASVWPRLELGLSKSHDLKDGSITQFALSLGNSGVGPAIITDVCVTYNDSIANNWWHLFELQHIPDSIETFITNRNVNNNIIQSGETVEVLNLDINLPLANAFFNRMEDLSIDIYYESIYGEQWKYDGEATIEIENFEGLSKEEQFGS
ncbi:MAG: hypothetical protein AAF363_17765 [Bacteroidota bacterium]